MNKDGLKYVIKKNISLLWILKTYEMHNALKCKKYTLLFCGNIMLLKIYDYMK